MDMNAEHEAGLKISISLYKIFTYPRLYICFSTADV